MMNLFTFSCLIIIVITLALGVFIYLQNRNSVINQLCGLFNLSLTVWGIGLLGSVVSTTKHEALFWQQFLYSGVIFTPSIFFHYVCKFLNLDKKGMIVFGYAGSVTIFAMMIIAPTLFIKGISNRLAFGYWPIISGNIYILFLLWFFNYMLFSYYLLFRKFKESFKLERVRIKYLFVATAIGFVGGIPNFLLDFNLPQIPYLVYPIGNFIFCFYPLIITYAVFKHRLMNIDVFIKKSVTDIFLFSGMGITSFIALLAVETRFYGRIDSGLWTVNSLFIFFLVVFSYLFHKLKPVTEKKVEKMLFKDKYAYLESITQLGKKVINLDQLLDEIVRTLVNELALEDVSIYLYCEETNSYYLAKDFDSDRKKPNRFFASNPSILFMKERKGIIIWKEEHQVPDSFKSIMISTMGKIGVALSVPLVYEGKMIGLMNLSDKKTKETWTNRDLSLLNELGERIAYDLIEVQKYGAVDKLYQIRSRHERITSLAELGAGLCHQLNNPLMPIKGFLQLVGREGHKLEDLGVLKGEAEKAVDRIVKIIKEVEVFSETGLNIAHIQADVNAVMRKAVPLIEEVASGEWRVKSEEGKGVAGEGNITVTLDLDKDLPTILGDWKALLNIFVAIGTNGMEAMLMRQGGKNASARNLLKGGIPPEALVKMGILKDVRDAADIMAQEEEKRENKLTIRTRAMGKSGEWRVESGEKEGKLATNHSPLATKYIRVEITDTGEGIKPEDLSKLFNPMHSTKSMHIGLSLAIAHRLVEAHGGYMDVKSKVGEGTSFFINLPLAYNPSRKETTQAKEAYRSGQKTYMGMKTAV